MKKTDFNPPIRIKAIKAKGRSVALDAKFVDSDDWLKGLTVRVDNRSGKSFRSVRIEVQFRRPEGQAQDLPAIWYLEYGDYPFRYKSEAEMPPSRVKDVWSGESVEVSLSDSDFNEMDCVFEKRGVFQQYECNRAADNEYWLQRWHSLERRSSFSARSGKSPGWSPIEPTVGEPQVSNHKAVREIALPIFWNTPSKVSATGAFA